MLRFRYVYDVRTIASKFYKKSTSRLSLNCKICQVAALLYIKLFYLHAQVKKNDMEQSILKVK